MRFLPLIKKTYIYEPIFYIVTLTQSRGYCFRSFVVCSNSESH